MINDKPGSHILYIMLHLKVDTLEREIKCINASLQ